MCLSTVFVSPGKTSDATRLIDKVQLIDVAGDQIECTDLYGRSVFVRGAITHVDFAHSKVYISGTPGANIGAS